MEKQQFFGESYWKSQLSIDIYNVLLYYIKNKQRHPEQLTLCHILKERWDIDLLYSLCVNA